MGRNERTSVKIRLVLGNSPLAIVEELQAVSPNSAPSFAAIFQCAEFFFSEILSIYYKMHKVQNTVTDNKMVALAKLPVDAYSHANTHFIPDALKIMLGGVRLQCMY